MRRDAHEVPLGMQAAAQETERGVKLPEWDCESQVGELQDLCYHVSDLPFSKPAAIPLDGAHSCLCGSVTRWGPCRSFPFLACLGALRPRVPALEQAQPPPLVCQVAILWSRPGGEGWRASRSS